jgi:sugar phosphate isomerase/epimerase
MNSFQPSRREAIQLSVGGLLSTFFADRLFAKDEDPFGGFTLGIQTYTFRNFDLEPALKKIQSLGLKYGEFYSKHVPGNSKPEQLDAIKKLCKEYGVTPISFGVERFTKNHDENKKKFEFGANLGVKYFSADPDPDSFESLDKLVAEYKIAIAIHPHGPAGKGFHRWYSAQVIMKAVKDHHELIGTCLDTGHLIRSAQLGQKLDPVEQIKIMGARNFGLHLKDHNNEKKTDVVYGKDGGVLDVVGILKTLKELKFKGYIAIEYEAKPEEPSKDVAACIEVFKEAVKKS